MNDGVEPAAFANGDLTQVGNFVAEIFNARVECFELADAALPA